MPVYGAVRRLDRQWTAQSVQEMVVRPRDCRRGDCRCQGDQRARCRSGAQDQCRWAEDGLLSRQHDAAAERSDPACGGPQGGDGGKRGAGNTR